jgi:predicted nucleotidyltransferase
MISHDELLQSKPEDILRVDVVTEDGLRDRIRNRVLNEAIAL